MRGMEEGDSMSRYVWLFQPYYAWFFQVRLRPLVIDLGKGDELFNGRDVFWNITSILYEAVIMPVSMAIRGS